MRGAQLLLWRSILRQDARRRISTSSCLRAEEEVEKKLAEAAPAPKAPYIKKKKKLVKYGLGDPYFGEVQRIHSTRRELDQWLEHPTFFNMISEDVMDADENPPASLPPGEGPVLSWETCVVFPSDGTSWHPLNRKVKLTVRVSELGLDPMQKRRLLDLVEKRYKPGTDELTITCEKFEDREDNRKEALRLLYAVLEEVTNPIAAVLASNPVPAEILGDQPDASV